MKKSVPLMKNDITPMMMGTTQSNTRNGYPPGILNLYSSPGILFLRIIAEM